MAIETIDHLFWECHLVKYFWNKLFESQHHFNDIANKSNVFLYTGDRLLSYIYIFSKFYIYQCKFRNIKHNFNTFNTKLKNRKLLEHKIALENDDTEHFHEIWNRLQDL